MKLVQMLSHAATICCRGRAQCLRPCSRPGAADGRGHIAAQIIRELGCGPRKRLFAEFEPEALRRRRFGNASRRLRRGRPWCQASNIPASRKPLAQI